MKTFNTITNSTAVTQEILNAIAELDEFKGAWRLLGKLTPDRLYTLQKVALSHTIASCVHANGHQVMDTLVARVMRNANADRFDTEIEQLIAGFGFVSQEVAVHYAQIPFSQASIKQLHRWISRYQQHTDTLPGCYKKRPNNISAFGGDGNISCMLAQTTLPYQTESAMDEVVYTTSDLLATKQLHPLQTIAHFIGQFLLIHPFDTHNHALAHIILQLLLLQQGYGYVSYGALNALHEDQEQLYSILSRAYAPSKQNQLNEYAINSWMRSFLRLLLVQKRNLQNKIEREQTMSLHVSDYAATLLDLIEEHGKLSLSELVHLTGFNKHTTKKYVQELVKKQQIIMHGKARATWYTVV